MPSPSAPPPRMQPGRHVVIYPAALLPEGKQVCILDLPATQRCRFTCEPVTVGNGAYVRYVLEVSDVADLSGAFFDALVTLACEGYKAKHPDE